MKNGDRVIGRFKNGCHVLGVLVDAATGKVQPHNQPVEWPGPGLMCVYPDSIEPAEYYSYNGDGHVVRGFEPIDPVPELNELQRRAELLSLEVLDLRRQVEELSGVIEDSDSERSYSSDEMQEAFNRGRHEERHNR